MDGENNGKLYWNGWLGGTTIFGSTSTLFPCNKNVLKNRKEITEEVANCRANAADAAAARECRLDAFWRNRNMSKYIYIFTVSIYIYTSFYVHMQHMLHMPLL